MKKQNDDALACPVVAVVIILVVAAIQVAFSWMIPFAWNHSFALAFGWPHITFWEAFWGLIPFWIVSAFFVGGKGASSK